MKKVLKRILLVLLIVLIILLTWKLSLFIRARSIENKIADNLKGDYYRKTIYDFNDNGVGRIVEEWHGNKYSKMSYSVVGTPAETELGSSYDTWQDNENGFKITEKMNNQLEVHYFKEDEMPSIFMLDYSNTLTHFNGEDIKYYLENVDIWGLFMQICVMPFSVIDKISTEIIDGKEYYVIKEGLLQYTYYVEKDTYLITKTVSNMGEGAQTVNYEYSFEPITKESIDFPNLEEYYVIVN